MWTELPEDVLFELSDPAFLTRQHYSRATYAKGCHGPLCKRRERERARKRTETRAKRKGREYIPNEDIRLQEDEALMERIIVWHLAEVASKRLERTA